MPNAQESISALRQLPHKVAASLVSAFWKRVLRRTRHTRDKLATIKSAPRIWKAALIVRDRTGKPIIDQMREIARLWLGSSRLPPSHYYAYELYDDSRYTFAEKKEFVGWGWQVLGRRLNNPEWTAICDDKLMCYGLFRGLGLPHPEIYAVYHPNGRTFGPVPSLQTPRQMAEFLRHRMRYPFFGKPVRDCRGGGASLVEAIDRDRDLLLLAGGANMSVDDYVREVPVALCAGKKVRANRPSGYLFQELIVQHPLINRLSGGRVSTLRLVVLLGDDGPRLFRVSWKLPVGNNITDHAIGVRGNIKCSIDRATGRVERVYQGLGPEDKNVYALGMFGKLIQAHPDTREGLTDVQLPYWDKTVALCLQAAAAFPGIRYQSWDIAMGVEGPMLLELNHLGGILQVPGCQGLNDAEFRQYMKSIESA
jgi:hypothetical protein